MKIVLIKWLDACSTSMPIWQDRENIDDLEVETCVTAGILLKETDKDIRIILSLNPSHFSQAITIPKITIKQMWRLKTR